MSSDPRIGTELAGYRIEALLGRGGMGVVYRAHDLALDRPVALKILAPELAEDVRFRERFLRESRVAASIDHPNVVPVYDAGEVAGELFIAMRFVEGSDLKRVLAEGPLEKERAIAVVAQVAAALDAAHARGLVHRDVKPSNVLVADGDHVYLADFGLTRRLGEPGAALGAAQSLGTADYVAPEQIRGDEIDGRADLYSLGCLLYECLTGDPPFRRDSEAATLFAHLEEPPPAAPGLDAVMRTALAKEPDERFQSGAELVEAARTALGLESKRARWPLAVAAVGIALIGAALLAFFLTRDGGSRATSTGRLVRIDPSTGHSETAAVVGPQPTGVAVSAGRVWVTSLGDARLWRVDPATGGALRLNANGSPIDIATNGEVVYVANGGTVGTNVTRFDGASGARMDVLTPGGITAVSSGGAGVWLAGADVERLSEGTAPGSVDTRIPIPGPRASDATHVRFNFEGLAVGPRGVWVTGDALDRRLWLVDPRSGRVAATVSLGFVPAGVAVGYGGVWVVDQLGDAIARVDPAARRVVKEIRVGRGPADVAVGDGSVWVANSLDGTVTRIDPHTDRAVATIKLDSFPTSLAVGDGSVWVAGDAS